MVSTYLSYDLVTRDIKTSISRIASSTQVKREAEYYEENIKKVTSLDDFLDDYRLYSYAMKAHGLEDMIYAKAFMKKVLESDLNDENSYANKLTDERYRAFAASFTFSTATKIPQTEAQTDELIGLYTANIADADEKLAQDTRYYNAMLDKTTNVDVFLHDDRLLSYVLSAFDINEATYSYATLRGAMTSDLSNPASYFNTVLYPQAADASTQITANNAKQTLINERAKAIALVNTMNTAETSIPTMEAEIAAKQATLSDPAVDPVAVQAEIDSLQAQITSLKTTLGITDISEIPALRTAKQTEIASYDAFLPPVGAETTALSARITTENAAAQKVIAKIAVYEQIAAAFDFGADGNVAAGAAQTAENRKALNELYIYGQDRVTRTGALLNDEYYKSKIGSITTVDQLLADSRMVSYLRAAFGLTSGAIVTSTLEYALKGNPDDPADYLNTQYKGRAYYGNLVALSRAFNFQADGTLAVGDPAQTAEQIAATSGGYFSGYNDKDDEADEKAISAYKSAITAFNTTDGKIANVDDLLANKTVYEFAMRAVGLDPNEVSRLTMKNVLKSDLDDPRSYANRLKDDRYIEFAQLFNFDTNGDLSWPAMAQDEATLKDFAADYIVQKTRFATEDEKAKLKEDAQKESEYYQEKISTLKTLDDFLADRRLVDFTLVSKGIDPKAVTDDYIEKIFRSDLDDPESFANTEPDMRFAQIVASFNFDENGNVTRASTVGVQTKGEIHETLDLYLRQSLETQEGESNAGVRLALYFERMAQSVTSAYDILGDTAMLEFFRTTFSLPAELSNMDIDMQAKIVEKNLELSDLADPEKLEKLIRRFTIMYDLENNTTTSAAVAVLSSSGGVSISADLLLSISQLRSG